MQEIHCAIYGFDPGFAATKLVVEARIFIEELELLKLSREITSRLVESLTYIFWYGALFAFAGMFGPVKDVAFGGFKFACRLQHHFYDVLDVFNRNSNFFGNDDIDSPPCQFFHAGRRNPVKAG